MPRWGMVIDLDKCTACQACTIACRNENNIPFAGPGQASKGRAIFWNQVLPIKEGERHVRFIPLPCMHCDRTPCIKVCPVKATYRGEEGHIFQIPARCIGCRLCMCTCPYSRRFFNWSKGNWPGIMKSALNPEVSIRPLGVVEKCTFCVHRWQKAREQARAEGRSIRDGEYITACVQTCPAKARYFGDLDDPESTVAKLSKSRRAFRLLEELGTQPKVIYLGEGEWREEI